MAVNTILTIALVCIFSSVLVNSDQPESQNSLPLNDYLTPEQKDKICNSKTNPNGMCKTAGDTDATCSALGKEVNGTNNKCVLARVCSFVVIPDSSSVLHALNTTSAPSAAVKPEPNTTYITDIHPSETPTDFVLITSCPNDVNISFIYPRTQ